MFEYSPGFLLVCVALGLLYAYLLYQPRQPWGTTSTRILFAFRAILVTFISILLLGPILKLAINQYEKPTVVWLIDNSASIAEVVDSVQRAELFKNIQESSDELKSFGYDVQVSSLSGDTENPAFDRSTSDLNSAVGEITATFEGKNLASVIVVSDGIYNSGISPLYSPTRIPVYTVGMGDTTERVDISLKNLVYNKIAYQGNKFPVRAEVLATGMNSGELMISLYRRGKLIHRDRKNITSQSIHQFEFQVEADEIGIQRIDIAVEPLAQERNRKNNYASAFVEVVEGKKKIVLVAPSPHPDIKAIRSVIEKNANYELILHMPGIIEASPENLRPINIDLAIFHQVLDYSGKSQSLFNTYSKEGVPLLVTLGERSNLRQLASQGLPLTFETPGQWDAITPAVNTEFKNFSFSENINTAFSRYPPVRVPFGKFTYPAQSSVLLYQRIGRVSTDRPFLLTTDDGTNAKMGIMIGDGIWKWRMDEFSETQRTDAFDEVFLKLIQYLSSREDKKKFRCFPLQNEFSATEPIIFESQIYNELFEPIYGNKVDITLTNDQRERFEYSYTTSPGNSRYRIGGLKEGIYRYQATSNLNGTIESASGEFLVTPQNIESQNLTADFGLLRKWATGSGGKFYAVNNLSQLTQDFAKAEARSLIHTEESFNPLINLKLVFFFLLALISAEWFARKYLGGY